MTPAQHLSKQLARQGYSEAERAEYVAAAEKEPTAEWVQVIQKRDPELTPPNRLENGTEQSAVFEMNQADEVELTPATPDPREEIFSRIDGPELLAPAEKENGKLHALAEAMLFRSNGKPRPAEETQGMVASLFRPVFPQMLGTCRDVHRAFGVSPSSQSQYWKLHFRKILGELPNLSQRSAAARAEMGAAQLEGANHWLKKKRTGEDALNHEEQATESPTAATFTAEVNTEETR